MYDVKRWGFRRATHDKTTGEYLTKFRNPNHFQEAVWTAHGGVCHMLTSTKPISFEQLLNEIRNHTTNYSYTSYDLTNWVDGEALPKPNQVALALMRLVEAGYVVIEPLED